jgi:hypothetical protein
MWDLSLSKLYSNCLLSTLNARAGWQSLTQGSSGSRLAGARQVRSIVLHNIQHLRFPCRVWSSRAQTWVEYRLLSHRCEWQSRTQHSYELDDAVVRVRNFLDESSTDPGTDIEYGITVTKVNLYATFTRLDLTLYQVVERLDDPGPDIQTDELRNNYWGELLLMIRNPVSLVILPSN